MFMSIDPDSRRVSIPWLVAALRAAGEPSRLRALALLAQGELAVGELAQALDQSQPRVSRHLKVLTESGLTQRVPEGSWVFYKLPPHGSLAHQLASDLVGAIDHEDEVFARDCERLRAVHVGRAETAAAYFDANAGDWARLRALHLPEADVEAAILQEAGPGPFDLLIDVGAGQGRMLELFLGRAQRAEGFDTNRQMLSIARAALAKAGAGHAGVRLGDVYAPPFPQACADLVTVHQVLHFLPDPGRAVLEAAKLLRPGGRLLIVDFAPHTLEFLREAHAHRRLGFADGEIAHWLGAAGLVPRAPVTLAPQADTQGCLTVKIWSAENLAPKAGRSR